jgi:hypothetical protein
MEVSARLIFTKKTTGIKKRMFKIREISAIENLETKGAGNKKPIRYTRRRLQ